MKRTLIIFIVAIFVIAYVVYEFMTTKDENFISQNDSVIIQNDDIKDESVAFGNSNNKISENFENDNEEVRSTGNKIGDFAPDFELETLDGEKIQLSQFRGEKVFIQFMTSWCPYCKRSIHTMKEIAHEKNVTVLLINATEREKNINDVKVVVEELGWSYPVLLDKDGKVNKMYEISLFPTTFFINENGRILQTFFGEIQPEILKEKMKRYL